MTERFYSIFATWTVDGEGHTEPLENLRVRDDMSVATLLDQPARLQWREVIRTRYGDETGDTCVFHTKEIAPEKFEPD